MFSDNDNLVKTVREGAFPAEIGCVVDMMNGMFNFELSVMVGRQPDKNCRNMNIPVQFIAKTGNLSMPLYPNTFHINREEGVMYIKFVCVRFDFFQTFGIDNPRKYIFLGNGFPCSADIVGDPAYMTVYI